MVTIYETSREKMGHTSSPLKTPCGGEPLQAENILQQQQKLLGVKNLVPCFM